MTKEMEVFLEKYNKLVNEHFILNGKLKTIEKEVGKLLDYPYPDTSVEGYNMENISYLTSETIIEALKKLYEKEGWRYPTWEPKKKTTA